MGLTTDNIGALQSEVDQANSAEADVFISVHINLSSGLLVLYRRGDEASARYARALLQPIASAAGIHARGTRARPDLRVLNPRHNTTPIRVLLELGGIADRPVLESQEGRQRIAEALAAAVRANTARSLDPESGPRLSPPGRAVSLPFLRALLAG